MIYVNRYLQWDKAVMHFAHRPGEQLQVDFAGDRLGYVVRTTGEWIACSARFGVLHQSVRWKLLTGKPSVRSLTIIRAQSRPLTLVGVCALDMCVDSPTSKMKVDNKLSYKIVVGELAHKPSREHQGKGSGYFWFSFSCYLLHGVIWSLLIGPNAVRIVAIKRPYLVM